MCLDESLLQMYANYVYYKMMLVFFQRYINDAILSEGNVCEQKSFILLKIFHLSMGSI